ncbi:MAG TPA: patatin-like phospholipase family protein [Thermoanaerobaculia bacterium]
MMNQKQRDTLASCLTEVFGRIDDTFIDAAVERMHWRELAGGETLMKAGDPTAGVYFVISGRLRVYVTRDGVTSVVGEIGRGETVGEMSVLTGDPVSATVVTVRNTVLGHTTPEAFNDLLNRYPQLAIHMARVIANRLKHASNRPRVRKPSTICLLAITDGVDLPAFATGLTRKLDRWGVTTMETRETIDERFGKGAADNEERDSDVYHQVSTWLDDVEFWNEFTVLVASGENREWTRRCLRTADEVFLVARSNAPAVVHPLETELCIGTDSLTGARQTLVMLHDVSTTHPTGTPAWLDRRSVDAHFHVRPTEDSDMARLARIVSGNAIGLVLAGGGARGFAHLGVYKALEEAGIEVDFVGGTSIGSTMAAYISFDHRADTLIGFARKAFAGNPTGDLNLFPILSLMKGKRVRHATVQGIIDATGMHDVDMADSWRTMYCVASNYSAAREMVIVRGRLDRALRASLSIPVALPPVIWGGELLIDGAIFNNFPTDVMAKIGAKRIIGVDLSRRAARRHEMEELPSTWQLLWDRLRGRKRRRFRLPSIGTLLMGTTILYSESRGEQARRSVDLYLNPDLSRISLLDWKSFDRIIEIGYQHAKEVLAGMKDEELALYRNDAPGETDADAGAA